MSSVNHRNELDTELRLALSQVLDTEPSSVEIGRSLDRLKRQIPDSCSETVPGSVGQTSLYDPGGRPRRRSRLLATACGVVFMLGMFASTDVWAEVTRDYAIPSNEPKPIIELGEPSRSDSGIPTPGLLLRLVLLAHVISLTFGLVVMLIAWVSSLIRSIFGPWRSRGSADNWARFEQRALIGAIGLYVAGMLLGCCWAEMVWGRWWSWDPREAFTLFTIAIAILWVKPMSSTSSTSDRNENEQAQGKNRLAKDGTRASIAFCAIMLMYLLGQHYAALQQGNQNLHPISPTSVLVFFGGCIAAIWCSSSLARKTTEQKISGSH